MLNKAGFPGTRGLTECCRKGFPLLGDLPACEGEAVSHEFHASLSREDLRSQRESFNEKVLASLKELPFLEDMFPQVVEDADEGFMSQPRPLVSGDLVDKSMTRRIPVREERAKGWRARVVDHETESGVNPATCLVDKMRHRTLDVRVAILLAFMLAGIMPEQWKRDISKAFRRVPVDAIHLEFAWVV